MIEWRLPRRVSQSMRLRLERMSDSARQVATVAAALGRRFSLDDVAAMLALSPSALLAPVDELVHADLLAESDGRLMFRHDLTLEAVRASVPFSVLRSLDRQAASVLLAGGALPVEVATQLAESAEPGDEVAVATLLKAAEALGPTDPGAAADLGQRALELASRRHPLRGRWWRRPRSGCTPPGGARTPRRSRTRRCIRCSRPSRKPRSASASPGCSPSRPTCAPRSAARLSPCPVCRPSSGLGTWPCCSTTW